MERKTGKDLVPLFNGYQLLGSSQVLRFATSFLGASRRYTGNITHVGLCISGQTIGELHQRVQNNFYPVGENVIVMIGTNNILRNTPIKEMVEAMIYLLDDLQAMCKKVVVLTIPPIPKCSQSEDDWQKIESFNDFLRNYGKVESTKGVISIADTYEQFVLNKRFVRIDCFEQTYKGSGKMDLIHLNRRGLAIIRDFLLSGKFLE